MPYRCERYRNCYNTRSGWKCEATVHLHWLPFAGRWCLFTAYEWLDTKDKRTDLRLRGRTADRTVRVQNMFSYLNKLFFSVNLISQWNYFGQNAVRQDVLVDHFNMDIKLDYFFTSRLNLFTGIGNITNRIPSDGYSGVTRALNPSWGSFLLWQDKLPVLVTIKVFQLQHASQYKAVPSHPPALQAEKCARNASFFA